MTSTVNDLLMIGVNGPPLASWNARKHVMRPIGALIYRATGVPRKLEEAPKKVMLFA